MKMGAARHMVVSMGGDRRWSLIRKLPKSVHTVEKLYP